MRNSLSTAYLNNLKSTLINEPTVSTVLSVYTELRSNGFEYAGWAYGVASGEYLTGRAAVDFLQTTALMGLGGSECVALTGGQLETIKVDMAKAYVEALIQKSRDTGFTTKDIEFREANEFHQEVFENNGLTIENWTLNIPFEIYLELNGREETEKLWETLRETGGDGPDALIAANKINSLVGAQLMSADPNIRQKAETWFDLVPGSANPTQLSNLLSAAIIYDSGDVGLQFNAGDGHRDLSISLLDRIYGSIGSITSIQFSTSYSDSAISISHNDVGDLIIKYSDTDSVTLLGFYKVSEDGTALTTPDNAPFELHFNDYVMSAALLFSKGLVMQGTSESELLQGLSAYANVVKGGDGTDVLIGGDVGNTLIGNDDDESDLLIGGQAADTYYVGNGDTAQDYSLAGLLPSENDVYFLDSATISALITDNDARALVSIDNSVLSGALSYKDNNTFLTSTGYSLVLQDENG